MTIIAISRCTLAGATLLAEQVASELQIPCISREIIVEAAREGGISEDMLTEQMDAPPSSMFTSYSKEREIYLWYIRSALCQHALEGSFVYHGYGGHVLLADISSLLRVGVVAPMEYRIKAVMTSQNVDAEAAEKHIHHVDKWRAKWVRHLYGVDLRDPAIYDLVVNLEKLDVAEASHLVAQMATNLPRFTHTEETQQEIANAALVSRVSAALAKGGELFAGRLKLTAENNVLTISGRARTRDACDAIFSAANQVIGDAELRHEVVGGAGYFGL
jgi:cytidylate kinase